VAAHPPFQIDGNFGYVAAVAECFVQSHGGRITLLPSVPDSFPAGHITGLVARPGIQVDLSWGPTVETGHRRLVSARLHALGPASRGVHEIVHGGASCTISLNDAPVDLDQHMFEP
jgi:alpha-L-fucosidase 2